MEKVLRRKECCSRMMDRRPGGETFLAANGACLLRCAQRGVDQRTPFSDFKTGLNDQSLTSLVSVPLPISSINILLPPPLLSNLYALSETPIVNTNTPKHPATGTREPSPLDSTKLIASHSNL